MVLLCSNIKTLTESIQQQYYNHIQNLNLVLLQQAPGLSFLLPEQYAQQYPRSVTPLKVMSISTLM